MKHAHDDACCKGFEERITLYHYGELGLEESGLLEAHLLSCPACREYREGLALMLEAVPAYAPAPHETRRAVLGVMAGISPASARPAGVRRLVPAGLVAAGLLTAAVLITMYNPFSIIQKPPVDQALMAKADWDAIEHIDVINDLDVVEAIDNDEDIEEL